MKIDRLMGILTLLLQHEQLTAAQLAERFEVSKRTINRDIAALNRAGIPIVTQQGAKGGVRIIDTYKLEKTMFTRAELGAVLTGLSSLSSVAENGRYQRIIEKFTGGKDLVPANPMLINLASHYRETLTPKIDCIENAISSNTSISFSYCNKEGERQITADPYLLVFQWANWYLIGLDHQNRQFRLFKLNRMDKLKSTGQAFPLQEIPPEVLDFHRCLPENMQAVIRFAPREKYRLLEEYGPDSFTQLADGSLYFVFPFTHEDYLLSWVLSFGENAELLEPAHLRAVLKDRLTAALNQYDH